MKGGLIFCALVLITRATLANYSFVNEKPEQVFQYNPTLENTLVLPTNFAGQFIVNDEQLKKLEGNTIYKVELVYTQYKSSPTFDQVTLNHNRVTQILGLVPQLKKDNPFWTLVEQTGATNRETANTYFHGFVLHYAHGLSHEELSSFYEEFRKPATTFTVNNQEGMTWKSSSGTEIFIEANSVTYANGKPVVGDYEVTYVEYRNQADIAFSGIPMTYNANGDEYNFSSVGMFEITATQNGEELELSKPATINFNCTAPKPDVSFYQMNEKGKWSELNKVNFEKEKVNDVNNKNVMVAEPFFLGFISRSTKGEQQIRKANGKNKNIYDRKMDYKAFKDTAEVTMNQDAWISYQTMRKDNDSAFSTWVVRDHPGEFKATVRSNYLVRFNNVVMNHSMLEREGHFVLGPQPNNMNSTLLAEGMDAGHTYPNLVKGLNSPDFGVYNCDQIYRIGEAVALTPNYVDENGKEILNKHVACLIDMNYNGAFSFHPNNIRCDANGKNVLLLFTTKKEVYMIGETDFAASSESNLRPTFTMKNVTAQLKTSDDLKKMLGI